MRVLFVGDLVAGRPILSAIHELGSLVGVAIEGERHRQTGMERGVAIFSTKEINSSAARLQLGLLKIDLIVNFNSTILFGEQLLKCPSIGAINFQPGLLPDYAGLNVHQWAILMVRPTLG